MFTPPAYQFTDHKFEQAVASQQDARQRDAEFTFDALRAQIEALRESAAPKTDVGLVVPFSGEILHVREVGWKGRNVIFVKGDLKGQRVCLVLHHTQLQILLVPVDVKGEPAPILYLVPNPE